MKTLIKILFAVTGALLIAACAGGMIQIPQKYALNAQLEEVKQIYRYRIMDWKTVDNQSFIIETSPSEYYLLVLKIPSPELMFGNRFFISSNSGIIRAGLDQVVIFTGVNMRSSYPIERIYKIEGREQMSAIRDQLTGKKDNSQGDNNKGNSGKPRLPDDKVYGI